MRAIFFDIESNGFKRNFANGPKQSDKMGRVIQLAWEVYDFDLNSCVDKKDYLIKPDGWIIPYKEYFMRQGQSEARALKSASFWINNGFSTYKSMRSGVPMSQVLQEFIHSVNTSDLLVSHNISFDRQMLGNEMVRYNIRPNRKLPAFCTLNNTTRFAKLKLEDLFKVLFNQNMGKAHDAANDVAACRLCYLELLKNGIIEFPKPYTENEIRLHELSVQPKDERQ